MSSTRPPVSGSEAAHQTDAMLDGLTDWRAETLRTVRGLTHTAVPDVVETWKWMGSPVWEFGGIMAVGNAHKDKVKLTLPRGAQLDDPNGLSTTASAASTATARATARRTGPGPRTAAG